MELVLVLEDDPANLHGIAAVLRSERYSVLETSTPSQALEASRRCGQISAFVTDMDLPSSSGPEIARKMVAFHHDLPVLFISGTPVVWWTNRVLAAFKRLAPYNVDFIEKPFSASQLLARLRNLIERARTRRRRRATHPPMQP